jgi:hypothetical protein
MKQYLLLLALLIASSASAQFNVLEHTFPEEVTLTRVAENEWVYVSYNISAETPIKIYNLDYELIETLEPPLGASSAISFASPLFLSRGVFDSDNGFEYLYIHWRRQGDDTVSYASVYQNSSTSLISVDGVVDAELKNNKLILRGTDDNGVFTKVYRTHGYMPTAKHLPEGSTTELSAYPNPTAQGQITLTCTPLTSAAALRVVSPHGQVVHQALLPAGTSDYTLSTGSLAPGAYRYYIEQGGQRTAAKAFVVK